MRATGSAPGAASAGSTSESPANTPARQYRLTPRRISCCNKVACTLTARVSHVSRELWLRGLVSFSFSRHDQRLTGV